MATSNGHSPSATKTQGLGPAQGPGLGPGVNPPTTVSQWYLLQSSAPNTSTSTNNYSNYGGQDHGAGSGSGSGHGGSGGTFNSGGDGGSGSGAASPGNGSYLGGKGSSSHGSGVPNHSILSLGLSSLLGNLNNGYPHLTTHNMSLSHLSATSSSASSMMMMVDDNSTTTSNNYDYDSSYESELRSVISESDKESLDLAMRMMGPQGRCRSTSLCVDQQHC